jgi:phosphohistidine phosphatase
MRHAKSDWSADYGSDHDRPLNERGVRSARAMGSFLASEGLMPDLVISSTALRARSTADLAVAAGGWQCDVVLEPRLYGSGTETVVTVASAAPPVERLMLVGHQPTWSSVVALLTEAPVEMKTATVAVVDFDSEDWADTAPGTGRLRAIHHPSDLKGV